MIDNHSYEYDVALSFAGEDRAVAEDLAASLMEEGVRVFYDAHEKAELWGKDLYQYLQSVYRDKAAYCVIFVSEAYGAKLWTRHELKQAQARAFRENREYLLPLRLDDSEIPGINATVGYIDLRSHDIETVAKLICRKLFGEAFDNAVPGELGWDGDRVEFRGHTVASFWPAKLNQTQSQLKYVVELARVRYGDEVDWHADAAPCHDCGAIKGELHVDGCDVEQCPACGGQAFGCECIVGMASSYQAKDKVNLT